MAKIHPFRAIRPTRDKVHLVAARPFSSYKQNVLEAKLEDNPFTFLHIINPEFGSKATTKGNTMDRFELVSKRYSEFLEEGILIQDESPTLYIYRQSKPGHVFTGVICGASVDEYLNDSIKKHEATLTSREQMFTDYLDIVGYNAEPVLLAHKSSKEIENLLNLITTVRAEYEFTTTDLVTHELWKLTTSETELIKKAFEKLNELYIADGHHRSASSVRLAQQRKKNGSTLLNENAFLAYIIDESQLYILEFNRLVKTMNNMSSEEIITAISVSFEIEKLTGKQKPAENHQFCMCLEGDWFLLTCKPEIIDNSHPVKCLDTEILTQYILSPILGIHDLTSDDNISFMSGSESMGKLETQVTSNKYKIAFILYPATMDQVKRVADNQMIMPPKSTWVEPKLRSGLTIYNINE
ncbi:MAG: DUF1015 domain-containing protein [Crocinitomicaceae bacterium]|nr:DUF1015 domain-containing protein [Flavobacteriales bacterium]NQZ35205.1 DUF1015 domain-containing protein [Crocinitomicaceae bacterium]